ncbi:hypothetical protein ScPMuIL_001420 [Solemya velum]
MLGRKMKEAIEVLENLKGDISQKAEYSMLLGKVYNVLPGFDQRAEDTLSKAVKLDPKLVEAWNHLGECYWKHGNIVGAKNCFSGALNHSKNKISLRNLSMALRQMQGSASERAQMVSDSVDRAREAIQLDINDGMSWMILGNAYLSLFFAAGQNPLPLKQCMSAYAQAEKDAVANTCADLHFNRAVAYKYQEDYQSALEGFSRAAQLDPGWDEPTDCEKKLITYLTNVTELTNNKGKMKSKRIQTLINSFKGSDLGPYGGGSYQGPRGKKITLNKRKLSELKEDINSETVILGKVVCTITTDEPVPFTFCVVDEEMTCIPVSVYNIAQGCGVKIGDSVAVPEPFVQKVDVHHKDKVFSYFSIRVDSPVIMVVNGRKLGIDKQAPSKLSVDILSE